MKNGYDQFFKQARTASRNSGKRFDLPEHTMSAQAPKKKAAPSPMPLRKAKKRKSFPWMLSGVSFVGIMLALVGMQYSQQLESWMKRVEIGLGVAMAEEKAPEPKAEKKEAAGAEAKDDEGKAHREIAEEDVNHLSKLNERKKELDAREEELGRQEAELAKQREELDRRLKELEGTREKISEILQDRVKADDQKVETLVQMYSNMKAPQAAKVFESMDEDLAVEILGRMKKKNAADIMNLLKPEKTQVFSEKYAGYKRK